MNGRTENEMPKIIFTSRYIKNPATVNAGKLIRYMGTREGVEKLPNGIDNKPPTKKQRELICECITAVPEALMYPELKMYQEQETRYTATEFLDAFIERNSDRIDGVKKLVKYYGERPGVEKLGRHGLFSQTDDKIDIDKVADEVSNHEGILWTHVISLRREDAERLGYNKAEAWKELVRRNAFQIAEAHKIEPSQLQWYGAFHNTTHHPHIHLMVYSKDTKQGYLTNKGIEDMRAMFTKDIFRNEMYQAFTLETQMRDEVRAEARKQIDELLSGAETPTSASEEIQNLYVRLISQLSNYKGKKMYGYLPKNIKQTVDAIVAEFAKDERIAELYAEWNKANREKLSVYYDKKRPDITLEENKEFRDIKNAVIRSAVLMMKAEQQGQPTSVNSSVGNLILQLAKAIASSCHKCRAKLGSQMDSKLKSKIEQKKQAHGLKTDRSVPEYSEDEQGFGMYM